MTLAVNPQTYANAATEANDFLQKNGYIGRANQEPGRRAENSISDFAAAYISVRETLGDQVPSEAGKDILSILAGTRYATIRSDGTSGISLDASLPNLEYTALSPQLRRRSVLDGCLRGYSPLVRSNDEQTHPSITAAYLGSLSSQMESYLHRVPGLESIAKDLSVDLNGQRIAYRMQIRASEGQRECRPKPMQQTVSSDITLDMVVGNEQAKATLQSAMRKVLLFDGTSNPAYERAKFSTTYCLHGDPGNGKSMIVEALFNYGRYLAKKAGIAANFTVVSGTDFKSGIFSESASNLKAVLDEIVCSLVPSFAVFDEIDTVFASRDDRSGSFENTSLLGTMLNTMEGIGTPRKGNFLIISATNRLDKIDSALRRRLLENSFKIQGPQIPQDYVRILQNGLAGVIDRISGSQTEWLDIGKYCVASKLGGGDVKNIATQAADLILDPAISEELFLVPAPNRAEYIATHLATISAKDLLTIARAYEQGAA